jgi:MoaA/NifB/PqqE/SkfB family radical SAM enzyme
LLGFVYQKSFQTNQEMFAPTHFYTADLGGKIKGLGDFIGGCGAGKMYFAIQPDGLVAPCVFMPIIVGDLKNRVLKKSGEAQPFYLPLEIAAT